MLEHLHLNWLERIALRLLVEGEPITMQLERLYHQPSFGEDE